MRVIYFHQHFSTPKGSAGIRSYEMARHLIANGHKVKMVCGSYGGGVTGLVQPFVAGSRSGIIDGIEIVEFDLAYSNSDGLIKRGMTFIKFAMRSIFLAMTEKYDVLFATTTPLTAAIPGIFAHWLRGKPFVFEVRDLWPELPRAMGVIRNPFVLWSLGVLEWISYHSANRLIGLSPGIVEGISLRGIPPDRISIIPNGCDIEIFGCGTATWRPDSIIQSDFLAVFTGTHGLANGLEAVLNAAAELKKRNRLDIKMLLIGSGKLKPLLQARVKDENLRNVLFHDPVNKDRLAELMAASDIGMQILANVPAFYYGTSPNKFFDYIAAGLPVLNNYPGWLAEMIEDRKCGFSVPPDDPIAFADALEIAADNRELLQCMGRNARLLAESEFNRLNLANKWVDWVIGAGR
jgi:glycosyltransferase involved in cell wall biosynthesis